MNTIVHMYISFVFILFYLELIYSVDIVDEEPHFVGYSTINHYYYYKGGISTPDCQI